MLTRSQAIDNIIGQRQPLVKKIASVEVKLKLLADMLQIINQLRQELQQQIKEADINSRLANLDFNSLQLKITLQIDELCQVRQRLSRNCLTIGIVGLTGQGKSTFLQSITGATNAVIPIFKSGDCTAVSPYIYHHPNEIYAEVIIHSDQTFIEEVIKPYYQELDLGNIPQTIDEFSQPLPEFSGTEPSQISIYQYLQKDYHQNLSEYRHLLKPGEPRQLPRIPQERIYQYVCQRRFPKGDLISFEHLVVRDIKIFCPFQNPDLGKIMLIDTPGFHSSQLAEAQLTKLREEADIIIFIRKPNPLNIGWEKRDTDLYQTAAKVLHNIENRSFMILNRPVASEDNSEACQKHQTTIRDNQINVVRCEIVNCANPKQANAFINLVLSYLGNNITYLDKQDARSYQRQINQLQIAINTELENARKAWSSGTILNDRNDMKKFLPLFNKLWSNLTWRLDELLTNLDKAKTDSREEDLFKKQVEIIIQNCKNDTIIPKNAPINQIINRRFEEGDWQGAYAKYLYEIRQRIRRNLRGIDKALNHYVERAKSQVTDVLIKEGNLAGLTDLRGSEFIKFIVPLLPDHLKRLKKAFKNLSNFDLSYRVHFHYRIRPYLDNLNPIKTNLQLSPSIPTESREIKAKEILSYLEVLQDEAVFKCQEVLEQFSREPTHAVFAEVEEFVDRVLRTKDVKDEWQAFLFQERSKIWPFEFGVNQEGKDRQQWLQLIDKAVAANQLKDMQFLN
ncbi:MAG TPA: hypothetical protein DEG17_11690 [Cyanobacteria bacterium UBA11149]|nr:hypothetical protein [Cyanobacteria bacterium UBA11367]HBE59766.1 hypothetical protein [Cyanobacteria bacterium UBA11366]HBK64252.1 hypothetical protein [Cyanobacteria bacterium UBA11166]HBR74868.1 hypothetical protein [Cyanobacteria bacterium UBA11159]HBS70876.1 hypothetical protein [Cyanobacteria bacterium UBA11153]HBW89509.1 hypothetical protein [Cyanobacteria bacterium UBA11149]HCA94951.1 hypothetical protein [Cyanobacteria bacterium UBA9226]